MPGNKKNKRKSKNQRARRPNTSSKRSFGSSSGCDFLTGFYFGLLDTNSTGGKRLEET